jgi:hypothetical protein
LFFFFFFFFFFYFFLFSFSFSSHNQSNLSAKMVNLDVLVTKVLHNFAMLGKDLQNFEASMRNGA